MTILDKNNQLPIQIDYSRQYKQGETFRTSAFVLEVQHPNPTQNDVAKIEGLR